MSIARFLRSFWEDIKAFRRGEKRVGSRLATGRVFAKKGEPTGNGYGSLADATAEVELKIMRTDGSVEIQKHKARVL